MPRRQDIVRAAALHGQAIRLRAAGKLLPAIRACREAARIFEEAAGREDPNAVHARVELAELVELRGDLRAAVESFEDGARALARLADERDTPEDIKDLFLRAKLGGARVRQLRGELAVAERAISQALAWARRHFGGKHAAIAVGLTAQGILRKAQGRYAEALRLYRRALLIVRAQRGPKAAELAALYHNLAGSEQARGRLAVAEKLARRGLAIRRRAFGATDPGTIADEAALAVILEGLGKRAQAEQLYLRALKYFTRWYGPRSYEVAVNLRNLSVLDRNAGRRDTAMRRLRAAVAVERALSGQID
jgi:tetratricopeptide (TPR) repeat protein